MNDVTQTDILQAVRESAVLADVSISMWGGTRSDAKLLNELKQHHNARGDVGRVVKNLMTGADDLLKKTRSAYTAVRLRHYQLTLPWVSDPHATRAEGPRLLPHLITDRYMTEMQQLKKIAVNTLEEFLDEYPNLAAQAKVNLGGMVGNSRYPTVDELRSSFRVHFDFEPLPEFRTHQEGTGIPLDNFMLERLAKGLHKKQERQLADASRVLVQRAAEPIKKLIERLAEDSQQKFFKEGTLDAVRDLATLLPAWNLTRDPLISEITDEINNLVDGLDAKTLRKNATVRSEVVRDAQRVADKMARLGV